MQFGSVIISVSSKIVLVVANESEMPAASNDSTSGSMKTMETRETQTHQTGMFESQNEIVQTFLFNSNSTQVRVQKIDAISLEPNAPPPVPHSNASQQQSTQAVYETSLIGDKILLLNQIDYSSLYRCVNVNSRKEFICKIVERCDRGNGMIWAHYQMADYSGINKLSEVLMNNRYLYLIFEKSFGDLLSYVRQKKRLQETEAKVLFKQISEIVKNCHKHNIVLRDLKLRKFVFADHQRTELKLESLEDSVTVENGTKGDLLQDKRGCPSYVSPEILKAGSSYSGRAADMWSLGVILYTMLVGKYPFSHSEHTSLFVKISRCNYSIPDSLSFQAKSLIRSLLKREPTQRLKSDEILSHPWLKGDEEVDDYDDEDEDDDGDGDDDGEYDDDDFEDNDDDYNDDDEGSDNNENEQAYTSKDDDSKTKYSKNYDHVVPESNNYKFA